MTPRRRPANRRAHETIAIEHEGQRYKIGLGRELVCIEREQLGPIVEVFLNAQQVNSHGDVLASDGAILMSMLPIRLPAGRHFSRNEAQSGRLAVLAARPRRGISDRTRKEDSRWICRFRFTG